VQLEGEMILKIVFGIWYLHQVVQPHHLSLLEAD